MFLGVYIIGWIYCFIVVVRLYFMIDFSLDVDLVMELKMLCFEVGGSVLLMFNLDFMMFEFFDNMYYFNLFDGKGVL